MKSEKKRETSNMNTNVAHVTFLDETNTGGGQALQAAIYSSYTLEKTKPKEMRRQKNKHDTY